MSWKAWRRATSTQSATIKFWCVNYEAICSYLKFAFSTYDQIFLITRLFLDFKQALAIKSILFEADYLSLAYIISFRGHIVPTELAHWSHRRL